MQARGLVALILMICLAIPRADAQVYPDRPIRMVVPFPPGGPTDVYARVLGQAMQQRLGQPVIIENRPGGGAVIGTVSVARAPADGYTLLFTATTHVISVLTRRIPAYDPRGDFAPVSPMLTYPFYLVVTNRLPVQSVQDLIAHGRQNPGRLTYGTVGIGTGAHLVAEMFNNRAGIEAVHVPYRGAAEFLLAVQSGEVDYIFDSPGSAQPHVAAGRARGLAVTSPARWQSVPHIPTMAESGMPGFDASLWLGVFAPAGTPAPVIDRLSATVTEILAAPEMRLRIEQAGFEVLSESPSDFALRLQRDAQSWGEVIRANKITVE